ncbi:MAG: ROK family protein [Streptosporangiaceae bacterium]
MNAERRAGRRVGVAGGRGESPSGETSRRARPRRSRRPVLAVDIGGTKLAVGLVEPGGRIAASDRVRTPQGQGVDAETLWRTVEALVDSTVAEAGSGGPAGVGVGCSGPMRWPEGTVSPLNIPAWRDFPLRERVHKHVPDVPVRLHNDAVCMAVGEHWRGAGRGCANMLGMVVSTGVGGGLVLGGRLVDGVSGNAGHVGHIVVEPDGPACPCGGRGCLEAVARGPGIAAWAQKQGWRKEARWVGGQDLAADAARGHPIAIRALRRAGHAIGVAIASATHLCDLEVVSVGGGLSRAGPLLFDSLEDALREHLAMHFARGVRVVPAALGQDAGLMGAAALVLAGDRYWNGD